MNRGRILTWSLMLGAIFPDSESSRDYFLQRPTPDHYWHRRSRIRSDASLWALLLAAITRAFAKFAKMASAVISAALTAIYAVGILSHILLAWSRPSARMIWSPLQWSRPAWDLVFIVDFTLTAILLVPQLLAWVTSHPEKVKSRAIGNVPGFLAGTLPSPKIGKSSAAPISGRAVLSAMLIFAALFLLPALQGWGLKIRHDT